MSFDKNSGISTLGRYAEIVGLDAPILIVDDDIDVADTTAFLLGTCGLSTMIAHNGQEALDILERTRPAIILLDIIMPVMNGNQFLTRMRADSRFSDIPVLIISAIAGFMPLERAERVIRKPFELEQLLAAIKACVPCDRTSAGG